MCEIDQHLSDAFVDGKRFRPFNRSLTISPFSSSTMRTSSGLSMHSIMMDRNEERTVEYAERLESVCTMLPKSKGEDSRAAKGYSLYRLDTNLVQYSRHVLKISVSLT